MKTLLIIFLLSIFTLISCKDATTEPNDNNITDKLIGAVTFSMTRSDEIGQIMGTYYQTEHIAGIKVELLKNGSSVGTSYTQESDSLDCFFLFDGVEKNVSYTLKASLNNDVHRISEPFTVSDGYLNKVNKEEFISHFGSAPDWFEPGTYYLPTDINLGVNFDFLENDAELVVFPQPMRDNAVAHFSLAKSENIIISILNQKLETVKVLFTGVLSARNNAFAIDGNDLEHGFYLFNLKVGEEDYYYPFSVLKYRDDYITTPYND